MDAPRQNKFSLITSVNIVPANLFAILILLNGLLITIETLTERFSRRFDIFYQFFPIEIHYYHRILSAVIGVSLIYLSVNLFARKRIAFYIALCLLALDSSLDFYLHHITFGSIFSAGLFFILIIRNSDFPVRSEPANIKQGLTIFVGAIVFAIFYGTLGFWLLDKRDFGIDFNVHQSFFRTLNAFSLLGNSNLVPQTRNAAWFLDSLSFIGATSLSVGIYNLFRPIAYILRTLPHERSEVQAIVESYGSSDLDFFKTTNDKSYFFSKTRKSVIAYKTVNGIALSLGDPVGPNEELENLIREFTAWTSTLGWRPVFVSVSEKLLPFYQHAKLRQLKIGEEAIINLDQFMKETIKIKDFRRVIKKFDELGYQAIFHQAPQNQSLLNSLWQVNQSWLEVEGRREMSFALGHFENKYITNCPVFYVKDPSGNIIAFVNEIPSYQKGMANIDLMRHTKDIPNGMMDYLFAKYFENLKERGFEKFNLGLAPLAGSTPTKGSQTEELIYNLINYLDRFFSFSGLRAYKQKFDPVWKSNYLIYQGSPVFLVPVALAIQKALEA